jgi:hypothetical protein
MQKQVNKINKYNENTKKQLNELKETQTSGWTQRDTNKQLNEIKEGISFSSSASWNQEDNVRHERGIE